MKTLVIVGVGALGSHVLQFLRSEDVQIKVIDFDRVEYKNTLSQFHGKPSVGKSKVESVRQTFQFLFGLKLDVVPHKLTGQNADQLLGKSDLILDCLDNGEARRVVQSFARKTGIPCLHGALAANGGFGRVVWTREFVIDDEVSNMPTCEDGKHLPFIAIVSAYMAYSAQQFLSFGKEYNFNIIPGGRGAIPF